LSDNRRYVDNVRVVNFEHLQSENSCVIGLGVADENSGQNTIFDKRLKEIELPFGLTA
jgi:hypothetical protein